MALFDYNEMKADADELLREFGMAAVLRRVSDSPTDRPCVVAIVDFMPREKDTSLANPTDRRVLFDPIGLEAMPPNKELDQLVTFVQPLADPPVEDEVLPFTADVKKYAPAGIVVLYEGTVRQ